MINLFNVDCMEYMKTIPDKHYDLAIVDPPYGIKTTNPFSGSGKLKNRKFNQRSPHKIWNIPYWDKYHVPDQNYFDELFRISKNQIIWGGNYFPLPPSRCVICWDKVQPWENFSQIEIGWTSYDSPAQLFRFDNRTGGKIHPTQKPVALYIWLLGKYASKGDKIFDSHLGSGSIGIACHDMGFDLDGCEIDIDYFQLAKERIENHQQQIQLFGAL